LKAELYTKQQLTYFLYPSFFFHPLSRFWPFSCVRVGVKEERSFSAPRHVGAAAMHDANGRTMEVWSRPIADGSLSSSSPQRVRLSHFVIVGLDDGRRARVSHRVGPRCGGARRGGNDPAFAQDATRGHTVAHGVGANVADEEGTSRPLVGTWRPAPRRRGVREQHRNRPQFVSLGENP
jgi:hypothetical protein